MEVAVDSYNCFFFPIVKAVYVCDEHSEEDRWAKNTNSLTLAAPFCVLEAHAESYPCYL